MPPSFPENFIAYHADMENRGHVFTRLKQVKVLLTSAGTTSALNDLRARKVSLEWQAILQQADDDYRARRYEHALVGYRNVSKKILALLEPRADRFRIVRVWPEGETITDALISASAEMLSHLIAEPQIPPLVLPTNDVVSLEELGAIAQPVVSAALSVSDDVIAIVDRATAAADQGRWAEAIRFYLQAFDEVPRNNSQVRAELLLNLGAVEIQLNKINDALKHLQNAEEQFSELNDHLGAAQALHNLGLAHLRSGSGEKAVNFLGQARKVAGKASLRGLLEQPETEQPPTTPFYHDPSSIIPSRFNAAWLSSLAFNPTIAALRHDWAEFPGITRSITSPIITQPDTALAPPERSEASQLAASLGSYDLCLKLRSIGRNLGQTDLILETPAQEMQDALERMLNLTINQESVMLKWSRDSPLTPDKLRDSIYQPRVDSNVHTQLGFSIYGEAEAIIYLPHLYHLVLPIKMGDCHMQLGEFADAETQYQRASKYRLINMKFEAPDLWRRMAENVVAWGDSLYREGITNDALKIYGLLMTEEGTATNSFFYTTDSLSDTGAIVSAWLTAVAAGEEPPKLNPAISSLLHTVRRRWTLIRAGLDFFGTKANIISPFSFRYLQEVVRYFVQRAISAEQRYIDFYTRFENGEMTRRDLESAAELSRLEVDAARQREEAAAATLAAAEANIQLARTRSQNAQDQLNQFSNVAWELETLAGFIAMGNAWTGNDLPKLHFTAVGLYEFDDLKHKVLSELTMRQTRITNTLQRSRMQNIVAEMNDAEGVAGEQLEVARHRNQAAQIETAIARARATHAGNMLEAFNDLKFNPEQWLAMATFMRRLANTALDRAIDMARQMERAYNFENFDNRQTIRESYRLASTGEMLGGELLLSDIDSFTHYHVIRVREKPIPVKWALSLAEQYPGQFTLFARTGRMEFEVDIVQLMEAQPGTYRHQLVGVEMEIDGFLPPTGLHGRLTNSGLGRYRDQEDNVKLRVQPAETLILSRYDRRQDSIILTPPQEMRALFEGNSVASGWTLEIPRYANDVDLNLVFDIRLVLYFECLFDHNLFIQDTQSPIEELLHRSRALYLRHHFPDGYYQLRESGRAVIELTAADFPRNQEQPTLRSLALAITTADGAALDGTQLKVIYPGNDAGSNVTINDRHMVPSDKLPINGEPAALGLYEIEIEPAQKDNIADLTLVMEYGFTSA